MGVSDKVTDIEIIKLGVVGVEVLLAPSGVVVRVMLLLCGWGCCVAVV